MKKVFLLIASCFVVTHVTAQLSIIKPDTIDITSMQVANGKMLYAHRSVPSTFVYELWATDGTPGGSYRVKDINPNSPSDLFTTFTVTGDEKYQTCVFNDELYFLADDGVHGMEFWKSDGTTAGTNLFFETEPGMMGWDFVDSKVPGFCISNGWLYFKSGNMTNGYELWKTDGTTAGTVEVSDIYTGATGSNPSYITSFNGKVYFTAKDAAHGWELWCSDGTAAGTSLVKDIVPGPNGAFNDGVNVSILPQFKVSGNYLYFVADNNGLTPVETHWWRTDGTANGTIQLETTLDPYDPYPYTSKNKTTADLNGTFLFIADDPAFPDPVLWKSDGTVAGTSRVVTATGFEAYPSIMSIGGYAYFNAQDADSAGLAITDGTGNGTYILRSFDESDVPFNVSYQTIMNQNVFFLMTKWYDYIFGTQARIVQTNGTIQGTITYPGVAPLSPLIPLGGDIIFYGHDTVDHYPGATRLYKLHPDSIGPAISVGVEENEGDHYIYAYPNPASGKINVDVKNFDMSGLVISLIDLAGRVVFSHVCEKGLLAPVRSIDIPANVRNGAYFINLQNAKGESTSTLFVVQR